MGDTKTWKEWASGGGIAFWDCNDDREVLRFETFEDAVEHEVDGRLSPGCDTEAVVREEFPRGLTVFGWVRKVVTPLWLHEEADHLAERFCVDFDEEFGGDDPWHRLARRLHRGACINNTLEAELATAINTALEKMKSQLMPWQCEQAAEVDLSLDELLAMLRETRPYWFTKDGAQ